MSRAKPWRMMSTKAPPTRSVIGIRLKGIYLSYNLKIAGVMHAAAGWT
jgi:hypothetical protein